MLWLDPGTHDQWSAATSHLPYLVASALVGSTPSQVKPLVGPGFRSTTRIAGTPASIMLDVLETNRENVLTQLEKLLQVLNEYQQLLSSGDYAALKSILDMNTNEQQDLISGQEET